MAQLLSNLPIGAKIKLGKHQVHNETVLPIVWLVVDKSHSGYPSNAVSLITERIIDMRCYDSTDSTQNGGINYSISNINQWLNSDAAAGAWYKSQHSGDAPPTKSNTAYGTYYNDRPGFLYNFTTNEKTALLPTTLTAQVGSDTSASFVSKIYLPSAWEVVGTHTVADGSSEFAYFKTKSAAAMTTEQLAENHRSNYGPGDEPQYWTYWTRSTYSGAVAYITDNGGVSDDTPFTGNIGIRPCANIAANTKISDAVDSDGCYTILTQNIPVISGTNSNLGTKSAGFSQSYTIQDADAEAVTVKEYIDNILVRSYVATLGASNTLSVTGNTWLKLANGIHTLKIVATDGFDEVTRTHTFTKSVTTLVAKRATPFDSATQPKSILVTVVKNIPEGAIFKVEACNNGYDATPTWEDITNRVLQGRIYDFTNAVKTASKWGVNIRVTVDRNGSEGACYITEIGGNFE